MVYGLGPQGARMLCQRGEKARIDWTAKNRTATKLFIEHTLRVADFMVALEIACRNSAVEYRRFPDREVQAPRWSVTLWHHGLHAKLGVIPDAVFALRTVHGSEVVYCLEADRATMPVKRQHLHQTSAARKFLAYHATWKQRLLEQRFGWNRFRVLTLTTSPARVEHLRQAARELPSGHGLFLFADEAQLRRCERELLSLRWINADGVEQTCS